MRALCLVAFLPCPPVGVMLLPHGACEAMCAPTHSGERAVPSDLGALWGR